MSRILKVSQSDYRLQVQSGGIITLDTGTTTGTVVITGNLDVKGTTTTVESSNTTVKDNILQLNYGQTGNGISSVLNYQAGLQIGRGSYADAQLLFDEQVTHYDQILGSNKSGTFVLKTNDGYLSGLQLSTITFDGLSDLMVDLKNQSTKVFRFENIDPTGYANLLLDSATERDYAIPNKKFITLYIQSGLVVPGQADVDRIYKAVSGVEKARVQATTSSTVDFAINSVLKAQLTSGGFTLDNINLNQNTISNTATTMILTSASNVVTVNSVLGITNQGSAPSAIANQNTLYSSASMGPGKSGVFFTNTSYGDELIAKNRSLLFSMLF